MASRSTRRSMKNSDIPKLEQCQSDEDSPEKKKSDVGRRRSKRHSPGSPVLSPPRKTRKIKSSSIIMEDKIQKSQTSPSKCSSIAANKTCKTEMDIIEQDEADEELENAMALTPKRNKRSASCLDSPNAKSLRTSQITASNLSKTNSVISYNNNLSTNEVTASTSQRRSTRSSKNSLSDKVAYTESESKLESPSKLKKQHLTTSEASLYSDPNIGISKKRSLSVSPETSSTNGTLKVTPNQSVKRKCISQIEETVTATVEDEESSDLSKNLASQVVTDSLSEPIKKINHVNGNLSKNESSSTVVDTCDSIALCMKRKLSLSPESEHSRNSASLKKSKVEEVAHSLCVVANAETSHLINKINNISLSKPDNEEDLQEEMDNSSRSELLIKEFGLSNEQYTEICKTISTESRDGSNIEIVEALVSVLLSESISIKSLTSPRFNKLLRQLLIKYCSFDVSVEKKHNLCEKAHAWSCEKKMVNLRHELELALMILYYDTGFYRKAEETASGLYKETKKWQDKDKTVKACLCLSKAYHAMGNISKARANITTAKTEALKIYTAPDLQAELDLQSGIMQVAEEKDMETAFSYFKEAATGFLERKNRSRALKYMLLTKLLVNRPEEGEKAVRSQCHIEDIDEGVEALLCVTKAAVCSSLADFKAARIKFDKVLEEDLVVKGVLDQLYHKMLEKNLLNIIAPYERIQIAVVAEKIGLARDEVERRLSQMILDKEVTAQLDHRDDCLYVYQPEGEDLVYKNALTSVSQVDKTLSLLNRKIKQLL